MLTAAAKSIFFQGKSRGKTKKDNQPGVREDSAFKKEYLTNPNLSIMTDLTFDEVDDVQIRKKGIGTQKTSSNSSSWSSYVEVALEECPIAPEIWENIVPSDITESVRASSSAQTYCGPTVQTCSLSASYWYMRLKRDILKGRRNKVYPSL